MPRSTAWIIGGGSGIGEAAAWALALADKHVIVSGRRPAELDRVVERVRAAGGSASAAVLDVGDASAVRATADVIAHRHGPVGTLVYSAGTNVRRRFWDSVEPVDIENVMDANLHGAVRAIHAVLPAMRERREGRIVLVSSWAAWRFSPGAGPAYSASKAALGVLAETLNAAEGRGGVTATHLCPGEVATDILDTRPEPPSAEARGLMLRPDDLGEAIAWLAGLPAHVCVNELVVTPAANSSYA